jgi:hypothetical protein
MNKIIGAKFVMKLLYIEIQKMPQNKKYILEK